MSCFLGSIGGVYCCCFTGEAFDGVSLVGDTFDGESCDGCLIGANIV
jgi:hypothetical protein